MQRGTARARERAGGTPNPVAKEARGPQSGRAQEGRRGKEPRAQEKLPQSTGRGCTASMAAIRGDPKFREAVTLFGSHNSKVG
jgi:hypothetical protein